LPRLFGTDGVRGIANQDLTPELALRIGRAGAQTLMSLAVGAAAGVVGGGSKGQAGATPTAGASGSATRAALARSRPFLVVGRDSRLSSDLLAAALAAGVCSVGVDVLDIGVAPTPGVALLALRLGAVGGVMISASHNPVDDNGIKFFDAGGGKLDPDIEDEIETKITARQDRLARPVGAGVGQIKSGREHLRTYADHLVAAAGGSNALGGALIVIDAAHGATAGFAVDVFKRAGARVVAMNNTQDGHRINVECGSTHPEAMARKVRDEKASAGLAFDGDGDRVIAADENGRIVDGDQILAILGLDLLARKALPQKTIVATVMSNLGLDLALREKGGRVVRTAVGDRNVLLEMRSRGAMLGGEQSGHVILLPYSTTGDGLLTGLSLVAVTARYGQSMSELAGRVIKVPQVLVNVAVDKKDKLQTSEKVATAIERVREQLGHTGNVLVRASGTEPLVRIMIEGRDERRIADMASGLAAVVAAELGGEIQKTG
jgi:phosphoglucosamine mutase